MNYFYLQMYGFVQENRQKEDARATLASTIVGQLNAKIKQSTYHLDFEVDLDFLAASKHPSPLFQHQLKCALAFSSL